MMNSLLTLNKMTSDIMEVMEKEDSATALEAPERPVSSSLSPPARTENRGQPACCLGHLDAQSASGASS